MPIVDLPDKAMSCLTISSWAIKGQKTKWNGCWQMLKPFPVSIMTLTTFLMSLLQSMLFRGNSELPAQLLKKHRKRFLDQSV